MVNGHYICFEGPDLVGKSTIARQVNEWLTNAGIKSIIAPQPGATPLGNRLREILKHDKDIKLGKETEAMMFVLDHMAFIENVLPNALSNGWILSDRCNPISALVYQTLNGIQPKRLEQLYSIINSPLIDTLFIMNATKEVLRQRASERPEKWDRYESNSSYMDNVRQAYVNLIESHTNYLYKLANRIIYIDANQTIDQVFKTVTDKLHDDEANYLHLKQQ